MKRIIAFILSLVMVFCLSACGNAESDQISKQAEKTKSFSTVDELVDYATNFWVCETNYNDTQTCYKIRFFYDNTCFSWNFFYSPEQTLASGLKKVLLSCEKQYNKSFKSASDFLLSGISVEGMESEQFAIQYDIKTGQINTADNQTIGMFLDNGTLKCNGDTYHIEENLTELSEAFIRAKSSIFTDRYRNLATYKDVKYDPDSYLGDYFLLTGTAELDDYYNYEYRDFESSYFCICVTPDGGGFTDRWYIYGDRYDSEFQELFESLKESPANVMLICEARRYGAARHEMAALVDFCYK